MTIIDCQNILTYSLSSNPPRARVFTPYFTSENTASDDTHTHTAKEWWN